MQIFYSSDILKKNLINKIIGSLACTAIFVTIGIFANNSESIDLRWELALWFGFTVILACLLLPAIFEFRLGKSVSISDSEITLPNAWHPYIGKAVPLDQIIYKESRGEGGKQLVKISYVGGSFYFIANQFSDPSSLDKLFNKIIANPELNNSYAYPITSQLLALSILLPSLIFLLQDSLTPIMDLVAYGAWESNAIQNLRLDRALGHIFLHLSYPHLFVNLLGLLLLGFALEHRIKPPHFLSIFFGGGIFATIGFYLGDFAFLVGASGGMYALFGAYLTDRTISADPRSERFKGISNKHLYLLVFIDAASAMLFDQIALGVHAVGLLFGGSYLWVLRKFKYELLQLSTIAAVALPLAFLSIFNAYKTTELERYAQIKEWLEVPATNPKFHVAAWNLAMSKLSPSEDLRLAINKLKTNITGPEDNDTLATLHARNQNLSEAIRIENKIANEKIIFGTQLARFERAYTAENPIDISQFAGAKTIAVDAICDEKRFVRIHTRETDKIPNVCNNQEIIYIRVAKAGGKNIRYKLDPKFMALPL